MLYWVLFFQKFDHKVLTKKQLIIILTENSGRLDSRTFFIKISASFRKLTIENFAGHKIYSVTQQDIPERMNVKAEK